MSNTSIPAPESLPPLSAAASASLSTMAPRAQFTSTAPSRIAEILSASNQPRVESLSGTWRLTMSDSASSCPSDTCSMPASAAAALSWRAYPSTRAPNALKSRPAAQPMCPTPTMPTVLPEISRPMSPVEVPPARVTASAGTTLRSTSIARPTVSSATLTSE